MAAVAAAAADRHRRINIKGQEYLPHFFYSVRIGDLYPDVIMMVQGIDLKPENLNPIHDMKNEQPRSLQQISNFRSVMFLKGQVDPTHGIRVVIY
ncbi:MAG: hypothetical protein WAM14_19910 [Candidatus Nitrosopolaris sp.]